MNKSVTRLVEVHKIAPGGFTPKVQIAACYLEIDDKLLILQRAQGVEKGKWGVPAGKLEINETPENAAKRELFEETGIGCFTQIQRLDSLYIRKPEIDYVYHYFKVHIESIPEVRLSDEHQSYIWATSKDIETIDFMEGAIETLQHYHITKNLRGYEQG